MSRANIPFLITALNIVLRFDGKLDNLQVPPG